MSYVSYRHDGRADKNRRANKNSYRHDRRADKKTYRHDRRADSQCPKVNHNVAPNV